MITPPFRSTKNWTRIHQALLGFVFCTMIGVPMSAHADFVVLDRLSEISYGSTNLGGVNDDVSTTDSDDLFSQLLSGSNTHIEPGGKVNTGTWLVSQDTQIGQNLISSQMETTSSITGDGSGILIGLSLFELEFENIGTTWFELSGSHFGTPDLGANDFYRVQLEEFDGVTFVPLFSTGLGDSLNSGAFSGVFQDGTTYRLEVTSSNLTRTNEAFTSGATINLAMSSVPEPSAAISILAVLGMVAVRRKRS